jgi:hypothetical protein
VTDTPDLQEPPPAPLSRAIRRGGRRSTRFFAVLSLLVALGAAGYVLTTQLGSSRPASPLAVATAPAWRAAGALSEALRGVRRGTPRAPVGRLAAAAYRAAARADRAVRALPAAATDVPLRDGTRTALRADQRWAAAVAAVAARPHGPRRAGLGKLAGEAAQATSLVAHDLPAAADTVGGTGKLLAATR